MNVHPQLEELEERAVPTAADLTAFQQQLLPLLKTEFHALVPLVQSTLQTNLNRQEALAPLFPPAAQPLLRAVFAQEQQVVNAVPALVRAWFDQAVASFEAQLLALPPVAPTPAPAVVPVVAPGIFPGFFPGFFGFPGVGPFGFTAPAFTTGTFGTFGTGGSFSDPPSSAGHGMGGGLWSMAGAMTLAPSSHP